LGGQIYSRSHFDSGAPPLTWQIDADRHLPSGGRDACAHPLKTVKQDLLVHQLCREIALKPLTEAEVAEYLAMEAAEPCQRV
jgi:hypothetical protein